MGVEESFSNKGGEFILPFDFFKERLLNVKAFIFDWDGVFNSGVKEGDGGSPFSEADSMGINLLRFGYYLKNGKLPHVCIITGENNRSAFGLAKREFFDSVYFKFADKKGASEHILSNRGVGPEESAFVFDDVLDISLASNCGLRIMVRRDSSPLFEEYARKKGVCDYLTGKKGGENPVREACELMLGAAFDYDRVIDERVEFSSSYKAYLELRKSVSTRFFRSQDGEVVEVDAF